MARFPGSPPALDLDPYANDVLASPIAMHADLREAGPVARLSRYSVYAMGRHRNVLPVLRDWEPFSSTGGSSLADIRKSDACWALSPIVEVDPPRHSHVRTVMQRILSPGVIRRWRQDF